MVESEHTGHDNSLSKRRSARESEEVQPGYRLMWVVPLAIIASTLANIVFFFILTNWLGESLLMKNQFPPPVLVSMGVGDVILFSVIFSLGAGIVYAIISHLSDRPERPFIIISTVVLLLSFLLPLKIPTPPIAMSAKLSLAAMHIIGAVVVVGLLIGLERKRA